MDDQVVRNVTEQVCKISGTVNFTTVLDLHHRTKKFIQEFQKVTFDFAEVTQSDSSAIALLLCLIRYAKQQDKVAVFVNLPQQLLDIASLCGVLAFINGHQHSGDAHG